MLKVNSFLRSSRASKQRTKEERERNVDVALYAVGLSSAVVQAIL